MYSPRVVRIKNSIERNYLVVDGETITTCASAIELIVRRFMIARFGNGIDNRRRDIRERQDFQDVHNGNALLALARAGMLDVTRDTNRSILSA